MRRMMKDSMQLIVGEAPLRRVPSHAGERVSTVLLGDTMKVLGREGEWRYVGTEDGYRGWAHEFYLHPLNLLRWRSVRKIIVTARFCDMHLDPGEESPVLMSLTMGSVLELAEGSAEWFGARLADGSAGYVHWTAAEEIGKFLDAVKPVERVLDTARRLTGTPYLWGGNSPRGVDCSGFVQLCFRMAGLLLPRDARDQYLTGIHLGDGEEKPGDLVFFGVDEVPTHVGICTGTSSFLHSRGFVKYGSLVAKSSDYDVHLAGIVKGFRQVVRDCPIAPFRQV